MKTQEVEALNRDDLLTAYLSQHPGMTLQEWTGNGRAKVIDQETGEVSSLTQRQLRNEVARLERDALDDILAAAIPDGVQDTAGQGDPNSTGAGSGAAPAPSVASEGEEGEGDDGEGAAAFSDGEGGSEGDADGTEEGDDAAGVAGVAAESGEAGDLEGDGDEAFAGAAGEADAGDGNDGAEAQPEGEAQPEEQEGEGATGQAPVSQGGLADQLAQLVESFKEHNRHEKRGSLAKGGDLYQIDQVTQAMRGQGLLHTKEDVAQAVRTSFEALGMKLPGASQRSQMKTTFEAWVVNTGADIDQEFTSEYWTDDQGAPVTTAPDSDELMPIRMTDIGDYRMLERTKHVVTPENMADLLAFLKMNSWLVIAKLKKHLTSDTLESIMGTFQGLDEQGKLAWIARQEGVDFEKPSEWASLRIARSVYETFIDKTIPRLTQIIQQATPEKVGEEGEEPRISKTVAMEFMNELLGYFEDDYLITIAKHMWGTMTEEEFASLMGISSEEAAVQSGDIVVEDSGVAEEGGEDEPFEDDPDAIFEDDEDAFGEEGDELDEAFE